MTMFIYSWTRFITRWLSIACCLPICINDHLNFSPGSSCTANYLLASLMLPARSFQGHYCSVVSKATSRRKAFPDYLTVPVLMGWWWRWFYLWPSSIVSKQHWILFGSLTITEASFPDRSKLPSGKVDASNRTRKPIKVCLPNFLLLVLWLLRMHPTSPARPWWVLPVPLTVAWSCWYM